MNEKENNALLLKLDKFYGTSSFKTWHDYAFKAQERYIAYLNKRLRQDAIAIYCLCGLLAMACGYITYLAR